MTEEMLFFEKSPLSISEQINQLKNRNLIVSNYELCEAVLTYIGYYRLSGYMIPFYEFPSKNHIFIKETKFEQIIDHYEFDRQLRLHCLNAIERIEVSFRAVVSDYMSIKTKDSHWYEKEEHFERNLIIIENKSEEKVEEYYHTKLIKDLKDKIGRSTGIEDNRLKETFLTHYYRKYKYPDLPPSWMIFETLTFGPVVFLFKNLQNTDKKYISKAFGLHEKTLHSWMHSICYLRNLCAHHSRVWNRTMSISPKVITAHKQLLTSENNKSFFGLALIIKFILDKIDSNNDWLQLLDKVLSRFPNIKIQGMGFPENWKKILEDNI